jgi:hypothetical protein
MDLQKNKRSPVHPLESKAGAVDYHPNPNRGYDEGPKRATPLSHQQTLKKWPMAYVDVFLDDFSEGKFSLLQHALTKQAQGRVRIDDPVLQQQLHTFEDLFDEDNWPTQLEELVIGDTVHIGACLWRREAGHGWCLVPRFGTPLLWREPLHDDIQAQVVSQGNRQGDITKSELELAGMIGHHAILADHTLVAGETTQRLYTVCHVAEKGVYDYNKTNSVPATANCAASKGASLQPSYQSHFQQRQLHDRQCQPTMGFEWWRTTHLL